MLNRVCAARAMSLIFISHDPQAVAALCDQVLVMRSGKVVEQGSMRSIFAQTSNLYTRGLVAPMKPRTQHLMEVPVGVGPPLLEIRGVVRRFGPPVAGVTAVGGVSFAISPAESVGLVGPSGCGKTTLARIIVGLDRATRGTLTLDRQPYHGDDLPPALRRHVSLVFQDPFGSFDPRLRVGASVAEPLRLVPELNTRARRERVEETIAAVGLSPDLAKRYPHEFSGGQRQRLAIARALVTRPRLVVLDEPVSALDVPLRGDMLALLGRLRADYGLAYLLISHDLDIVSAVADRVLIMDAGRIVETGTPGDIFGDPQHALTKALIDARLPAPTGAVKAEILV
jgi:peptide/nickel transport system ATP-binding protein